MCVVSMVTEWGRERWPVSLPEPIPGVFPSPSRKEWGEFKELVKKAIEYDKRTNQPDCIDPEKDKWMTAIEKRLNELEKFVGKK